MPVVANAAHPYDSNVNLALKWIVVAILAVLHNPPFTPAADILKDWLGPWTCVSTSSNQSAPLRFSVVATTYGKWLQFSASLPAIGAKRPSHFVNLTTYDSRAKKWFIVSYSTGGAFQLSSSSDRPETTRQTWTNIYPLDPSAAPGTIVMGPSTFDAYNVITKNGKRVTFHTGCKKG